MARVMNFSAGPSALALDVLNQAKNEFMDYKGLGFGIMEISHRSKTFDEVYQKTVGLIRELYGLDDDYEVLFTQGGASLGFAMVCLNLSSLGRGYYIDTGVWTQKALKEAQIQNIDHEVIASSKDENYSYIPNVELNKDGAYLYLCSNNTIYATQYHALPRSKAPLVIDASSDIFSYELDFKANNIGVVFAGAQKNAGIAGVTPVIIKKELIGHHAQNVPTLLRYETYAKNDSMFNTPPSYAIYILSLVLEWIKKLGGLSAMQARNAKKAELIYNVIDSSNGFYQGHAKKDSRSNMNISFKTPNSELDAKFVASANDENMIGLKGHKHLGGLRASIYNAIEPSEVKALAEFMKEFARKNG